MLFLFRQRIILVSIFLIPHSSFSFEPDKVHQSEINDDVFQWQMINDFGQRFNVKYWVLQSTPKHDSSWKHWWQLLMKENDRIAYFASNLISSKNCSG